MTEIGYVRVSSVDQNLDRQLDGLTLDQVFEEKASAGSTKRPILKECLRFLRSGDTLHVHSIDRLARNLADLMKILSDLTGKGISVKFHKENLTFAGDSKGDPFQDLQLQIIGAVAQFERSIIRERQREGIAKAQAKGKHCGRKAKLRPDQVDEVMELVEAGEEKKTIAEVFEISRQTLYRVINKAKDDRANQKQIQDEAKGETDGDCTITS